MSRLNHSFNVEHAEIYGIECAILISHFQFWIEQNQRMGRNFYDDRTWMYQTQKEIAAIYPYFSEDHVCRLIKKLIDKDVLIKGNYNKTPFDKTVWYAFKNEKMFTKPQNCGIDTADLRNQIPQNCGMRFRNSAEPIPDTKTDTKNIEQQQASPKEDVVVSFSKKKNNNKPKKEIYQCLKSTSLSEYEMQTITNDHEESEVIKAVQVMNAQKKPIENPMAYLLWALTNEVEPPTTEEELIEENKNFINEREKQLIQPEDVKLNVLSKYVEIIFVTGQKSPDCIEYKDREFKKKLIEKLKKYGFKIKNENK